MSEQLTLSAETRDRAGKGASREMRRQGRVPAVIYGQKQEPLPIHVEEKALVRMLQTGHFMNSIVMIDTGGTPTRTLPKDVQFHPVTDRPLHVDFLRISEHSKVHVNVPIRFVNDEESPGLKRGGVLNAVLHDLELVCDASKIPDDIVIDLTGLDIGDSVHLDAIRIPEGCAPATEDLSQTIATIVAPSAMKQVEEEEGAPAPAEVPTVGEETEAGEAPEGETSGG
jgi:large subunit ribosomal protein L25